MPKLKTLLPSLEGVDEKYHDLYSKQEDGTFILSEIDEKDYKTKLDEFRNTNRRYFKDLERLQADLAKLEPFKDADPEKYQQALEALEAKEKERDKEMLEKGEVDQLIIKRTEAMKADFDKQLKAKTAALEATTKERDQHKQQLAQLVVDSRAMSSIAKVGKLHPGAEDDFRGRAHNTWKLDENGVPVARNAAGEPLFGKSGDPLTFDEWAQGLLEDASFLFQPASGGGAAGGDKSGSRLVRTIDGKDPRAFGNNLEKIATGEVLVQ